jgi:hypothetical protein
MIPPAKCSIPGTIHADPCLGSPPMSYQTLPRDQGVRAAIGERDGPIADYSQAPPDQQPDPKNVIR